MKACMLNLIKNYLIKLIIYVCLMSSISDVDAIPVQPNIKKIFSSPLLLTNRLGEATSITASLNEQHINIEKRFDSFGSNIEAVFIYSFETDKQLLCEIHSQHRLKNIRLINYETTGGGYLVWVDRSNICLSEIPGTIPQKARMNEPAYGFPSCFSADHIISLSCYEGWETFFKTQSNECDIGVVSVVQAKNELSLVATNHYGKTFRFAKILKAGDVWHAFNGAKEIFRTSPTGNSNLNFLKPDGEIARLDAILIRTNNIGIRENVGVSLISKRYNSFGYPVVCYQLVESKNKDISLSGSIWVGGIMPNYINNVSITKVTSGVDYFLSWTDYWSKLYIILISVALPSNKYLSDPEVGILSHPKDSQNLRGGVDHIIDLQQFVDGDRFFKGGGGVASAKEEKGALTLTVTNAAGSKFTFSNPDGQWHASSFWGEIKRIKP